MSGVCERCIGKNESEAMVLPYIVPEQRAALDPSVDELAAAIRSFRVGDDNAGIAGILNYCITRLMLEAAQPARYHDIAILTGVLENVKQEFYRKFAAPYEEAKIKENGPVYP